MIFIYKQFELIVITLKMHSDLSIIYPTNAQRVNKQFYIQEA